VTLYNIPLFASPIDVPTLQRLAEFPRVIGIKDSSGDVAFMMRMIAAIRPRRPEFCFLTGWDAVLVPMLLVGANGGTNAASGVVPELTRKLYDLTCAGNVEAAVRMQYGCWSYSMLFFTPPISPKASEPPLNCAGSRWDIADSHSARLNKWTARNCREFCAA
jgi:dihydrodipicolinate synthase/N-acetylneuraminate lyase